MHILVYQNDRSRNASSDRKMNHIILLVNVQTFQKYNYYYYFLFIGCNHKMWFQGDGCIIFLLFSIFSFIHFCLFKKFIWSLTSTMVIIAKAYDADFRFQMT